jgi:hypothetical protein
VSDNSNKTITMSHTMDGGDCNQRNYSLKTATAPPTPPRTIIINPAAKAAEAPPWESGAAGAQMQQMQ